MQSCRKLIFWIGIEGAGVHMAHAQCIPFHLIDDALVLLTLSSQKQKTSGAAGRLALGLVQEPQFQEAILLLRAQGFLLRAIP